MEWRDREESVNVEDRRSMSPGLLIGGGGVGGVIMLLLALFLGGDPSRLVNPGGSGGKPDPRQAEVKKFVSVVLRDTEDVWDDLFRKHLNVPALVCGPGSIERAHKPDEYVELSQLARCDQFLQRLVGELACR